MAIESNRIVRASGVFLLAAACLGGGCAIINRMDGVAESRAVQKTGIPADARILQMSETRMVLNQRYPVVRFLLRNAPSERRAVSGDDQVSDLASGPAAAAAWQYGTRQHRSPRPVEGRAGPLQVLTPAAGARQGTIGPIVLAAGGWSARWAQHR